MANFVQEKALDLAPLWLTVKKADLIPHDDLKEIISRMRKLEENCQRDQREFEDLQDLITFITDLYKRLDAARDSNPDLRKLIRYALLSVVGSRFQSGIHQYGTHYDFWQFWIHKYLEVGWSEKVSEVYKKAVAALGNTDPKIWTEAAQYPLQLKKQWGIQESRQIILECLRRHSDTVVANLTMCCIELRYKAMLEARFEKKGGSMEEIELSLQPRFDFMYTAAQQNVGTQPGFYIDLLAFLNQSSISDAQSLSEKIKADFLTNCARSEDTYIFLGLMHLDPKFGGDVALDNIRESLDMFRKGTEAIPSAKLYRRFIEVHFQILDQLQGFEETQKFVSESLTLVYAEAHGRKILTLEDYKNWIVTVQGFVPKPKIPFDLGPNHVSHKDWKKIEDEDGQKPRKVVRTICDEGGAKESENENDQGNSPPADPSFVIDLAMAKFPHEGCFVLQKLAVTLGRSTETPAQFYSEEDKAEKILDFIKQYVFNAHLTSDEVAIWTGALLRMITTAKNGWSRLPELIALAKNRSIQNQLAEEYLRFTYSKENGSKLRRAFLKKLYKANNKAPLDGDLMKRLQELDETFNERTLDKEN